MRSSPTPTGDAATLTRLFDLVWGPDNPAIEGWHEALEAWSQAWARSVLPGWPWVVPAETLAAGPPARAEAPEPFRTHPPGKTLAELSVGDSASLTRRFTQADIDAFARISGDDNPAHVDATWAESSPLGGRVAHGMLTAGLVSAVLGTMLPGPGSIYMSQTLRWLAPVRPDDLLTATATVTEVVAEKGRVVLETVVTRDGEVVLTGEALVMPPGAKPRRSPEKSPRLMTPQPVEQPAASAPATEEAPAKPSRRAAPRRAPARNGKATPKGKR
jgi:3-hydroxybutyryl-CoA dehydratase